jgi:hypothetical protein
MSKYLKTGKCRLLKSHRGDYQSSMTPGAASIQPAGTDKTENNICSYTENDLQLFNTLNNTTSSIRNQPASKRSTQNFQTPYSTQDLSLFEQIFPSAGTHSLDRQRADTRRSESDRD